MERNFPQAPNQRTPAPSPGHHAPPGKPTQIVLPPRGQEYLVPYPAPAVPSGGVQPGSQNVNHPDLRHRTTPTVQALTTTALPNSVILEKLDQLAHWFSIFDQRLAKVERQVLLIGPPMEDVTRGVTGQQFANADFYKYFQTLMQRLPDLSNISPSREPPESLNHPYRQRAWHGESINPLAKAEVGYVVSTGQTGGSGRPESCVMKSESPE